MVRIDRRRALGLLPAAALLRADPALAGDYPERSIRLIVPTSPGGVTDVAARILARQVGDRLGQPVVVDNRPGAGGNIGLQAAARAAPDGYTLLACTNSEMTINPVLYQNMPLDPRRELRPVAMLADAPLALATNAASPYRTLQDLVTAAKARPGTIPYASPGTGTMSHLTAEWYFSAAGISLQHVPYHGGSPAGLAIANGEVPLGSVSFAGIMPHLAGGLVRLLAVTGAQRTALSPETPTVQESGIPDFDASTWAGLFAPARTPPAVLARWEAAALEELRQDAVVARLASAGMIAMPADAETVTRRLDQDAAHFARVVRDTGLSLP